VGRGAGLFHDPDQPGLVDPDPERPNQLEQGPLVGREDERAAGELLHVGGELQVLRPDVRLEDGAQVPKEPMDLVEARGGGT